MVEFLVALGALSVGGVVWFIKRLQKKVEIQDIKIEQLENERIIDEAKVEALEEAVVVNKELDTKEIENIKKMEEAESAEDVIDTVNQYINDFNNGKL